MIILGQEQHGEVGRAVIRLLQNDLSLHVIEGGLRTGNDKGIKGTSSSPNLEEPDEKSMLAETSESPTRRPIILRRLKVTRESLHHWLQRKTLPSKR